MKKNIYLRENNSGRSANFNAGDAEQVEDGR